jgi:hypothetical protein
MAEKKKFENPELSIHREIALWAANCAEHTLHLFECKYPDDKRLQLALIAIREWVHGERSMVSCREAAFKVHAAARGAQEPDAIAAARATGQAASVPHMYTHCTGAAEYAAKAAGLSVPKEISEQKATQEREWQWDQLREGLQPIGFPNGKKMILKFKP